METCFAPAKKAEKSVIPAQIESISSSPIMSKLMEATSGLLVVVNEDRQIVGLNEAVGRRVPARTRLVHLSAGRGNYL
ncbi:MAG: hypothetical protein PHP95_02340 [Desulfuromonadaceae bacterium]|nr:hypothetical protein [Desulfuromonadaceae bacterium]MDD2847275.1 hypothetical protein [Desulfuromonadaceae bacterium]MDD4130219.1 hypothetical protein [Desulfuromonadaceae bacterium]